MANMETDKLKVCLLSRVGSRAYNFATPESDDDQRGFGLQTTLARMIGLERPKDHESKLVDGFLWDVSKFTRMAVKANTNALDTLFAESQNVLEINDVGELYREYRHRFLSTHSLYNVLKGYALNELDMATGRKKPGDMGAKRRTLVEKHGYSGKNLHHACRLLKAGTEAFRTGQYRTFWPNKHPDWSLLMDLKSNILPLEEAEIAFQKTFDSFEVASKKSVLSQEVDLDFINSLLIFSVKEHLERLMANFDFPFKNIKGVNGKNT